MDSTRTRYLPDGVFLGIVNDTVDFSRGVLAHLVSETWGKAEGIIGEAYDKLAKSPDHCPMDSPAH
jgi:hypothetical protein